MAGKRTSSEFRPGSVGEAKALAKEADESCRFVISHDLEAVRIDLLNQFAALSAMSEGEVHAEKYYLAMCLVVEARNTLRGYS